MKVLVAGGGGQVGRALVRRCAARGLDCVAPGHAELDITRADLEIPHVDCVINAAAYTAVDRAESEAAAAYAVNRDGAVNLARAAERAYATLVHISTDYVFDGANPEPYVENDPVAPLGVYGASKLAGERAVLDSGFHAFVVRTSWVFGVEGANFVKTMLRLGREREVVRVVADQRGCPTFADDLADALLDVGGLARSGHLGPRVYHFCNDGPTTWHGFAQAIMAGAGLRARVDAITTAEYPTAARRPANSVLDTTLIRSLGVVPPPWTAGLHKVITNA
jgi:dTDP-4-dehydrorhamnose reductase